MYYRGDNILVGVADSVTAADKLISQDISLYDKLGFDLPSYDISEVEVKQ